MRILEKAERASERWLTDASDFAYPPVIQDAQLALSRISGVAGGVAFGGFEGAERQRLIVGHPDVIASIEAAPQETGLVVAVEIVGNFLFDPATHRDFLGACLGTGIQRDRVGDIIVVGERGAQLVTTPELADHFERDLTQVRSVPVQCARIPLDQLRVQAPKVKELKSSEASLRIDAVASAGFQMSRSKMQDLITSGDLRVNWKPVLKKDADVKPGDVISVRGKGRLTVVSVVETKKERYSVEMKRLL